MVIVCKKLLTFVKNYKMWLYETSHYTHFNDAGMPDSPG